MKSILGAALIAAILSSAATFLLSGLLRAPPPASSTDTPVAELRAALDATRRELAEIRKGSRTAETPEGAAAAAATPRPGGEPAKEAGRAPGAGVAGKEPVPAAEVPAVEEAAGAFEEDPADRMQREFAAKRPGAQVERVRDAAGWEGNPEVRARWILLPEAEVVTAFGKPDEIYMQENGTESWIYRLPSAERDEDGNMGLDEITVDMNRGRLVRVND